MAGAEYTALGSGRLKSPPSAARGRRRVWYDLRMASHAERSGEPFLRRAAEELHRTVITPVVDEPHGARVNLLYCATIQLAWNELCARSSGSVRFADPCPLGERLNLATATFTKDDLDDASYIARAGEGNAVLRQIHDELERKFGGAASPGLLPEKVAADALLVYAYLFKDLPFATPFFRDDHVGLSFGEERVRCFGLWETLDPARWKELARQVIVHDYTSESDFIVELLTKAKDDRLLIARIRPAETLLATVERALDRTGPSLWSRVSGGSALRKQDVLKIPIFDFDILRSYPELAGRRLAEGHLIEKAAQSIRFRLDDKGALLKSEFMLGAKRGGLALPGFPPRYFLCDGPFLVLLLRKERRAPYLALWVDNTELLIPVRTSDPPSCSL